MELAMEMVDANIEMLFQLLSSSMDANDYANSKHYASYCELAICEVTSLPHDNDIVLKFYAFQMMLCIISNDCLGARLLWKRAPLQLKTSSPMTDFATLYQVILSLKDKDVINAYKILKNTSWQPYIINHTINARKAIQKREIGIISKAYSTISLTKMCAILDMNNDEIMNEIKAYNWQYDQSTNSVKITSVITDYDYQNELLNESEMILKLSKYMGHFEQKPIKVDLSSKN